MRFASLTPRPARRSPVAEGASRDAIARRPTATVAGINSRLMPLDVAARLRQMPLERLLGGLGNVAGPTPIMLLMRPMNASPAPSLRDFPLAYRMLKASSMLRRGFWGRRQRPETQTTKK